MRWGGVLLAVFIVFHLLHLTGGVVGFKPGSSSILRFTKTWWRLLCLARRVFSTSWPWARYACTSDHGIWSMLQTLGWSTVQNTKRCSRFFRGSSPSWCLSGFLSSGRGDGRLGALKERIMLEAKNTNRSN